MNISKSTDILLWPLIAVLIYFVCQLLGQFVVQTIGFFSSENGSDLLNLGNVAGWASLLSAVVTVAAMSLVRGFHLLRSFAFPRCSRGNVGVAFLAVLLTLLCFTIFNDLLESQLGWRLPPEYEALYRDMISKPVGVVSICLFAPVCEEVVFRAGIMNPLLRHGVNPWIPIALSSVIFGLFHGNLVQIAYAIPAGLVFAIVYYLTGSLLISIFCHALNNTVMVVLMLSYGDLDSFRVDGVIGVVPALVVVVILMLLIVYLLRGLWRNTSGDARLYFMEKADEPYAKEQV